MVKKGKISASEESPAVAWGGGKGGGASATLSPPQTTSRLASLADFFFFLPQCAAWSQAIWDRSAVEEKDKERGRITGSPSSKYEHRRGIGIVIRNASREGPDRLLFFCAAFILH